MSHYANAIFRRCYEDGWDTEPIRRWLDTLTAEELLIVEAERQRRRDAREHLREIPPEVAFTGEK